MGDAITLTFALIFLGAAVLSSLALYLRQPIIIAYMALGVALGPSGFGWSQTSNSSPGQGM